MKNITPDFSAYNCALRVYEIASIGYHSVRVVYQDDSLAHTVKQITEFFSFRDSEFPDIYLEITKLTPAETIRCFYEQRRYNKDSADNRIFEIETSLPTDFNHTLSDASNRLLETAIKNLELSIDEVGRILRVARTIATIEKQDKYKPEFVAEAIQYMSLPTECRNSQLAKFKSEY